MTIAGGEHAHVGDVVATRRNNRRLVTTEGEPVRNRELWTVTGTHGDGTLTVTHHEGHGQVILPADYVTEHVRLGYAATEHGYQSDTVTVGINLASEATTRRGLYVAVTRGRVRELDSRRHRERRTSPRPGTSSNASSPWIGPTSRR